MENQQKKYETVLGVVTGFLILYLIFKAACLLYVAASVGLASSLSSWVAGKIHVFWGYLTKGIGFVSSHIILGLLFFLMLFPISLIYRVFNKSSLMTRKKGRSFYEDRMHEYTANDLENPW